MGEGSDFIDEPSQGGGEYYGPVAGYAAPAQGPWGPADQTYDPRYVNMQPMPVHRQPPPEWQPPVASPPQRPMRRRKASKGMQRMYLVQYYESLLEMPLFGDPNDPYANQVQAEVSNFAQRRIDELLGEAPEKGVEGFSVQEVQVLKALIQRMTEPDPEAEQAPSKPPPTSIPPATPSAPSERSIAPVQAAPPPRPPPTPAPEPEEPSEQPQALPEAPPRQMGPRVIARPTPAQRQALEAARSAPRMVAPQRQPPAQIVQHMMAPAPVPAPTAPAPRGRRGRGRAQTPPTTPGPPPPLRYAMPQGDGMTAVSAMQASRQIEAGGTVLSQTFVKSAGK